MIDPTIVALVEYQDWYREALIDAATYRRMCCLLLDQAFQQAAHLKKTEARLRQVMGIDPWTETE